MTNSPYTSATILRYFQMPHSLLTAVNVGLCLNNQITIATYLDKITLYYKTLIVSSDLALKTLLMIGDRLPVGIYADALEEELPQFDDVGTFLRDWEAKDRAAGSTEWRNG